MDTWILICTTEGCPDNGKPVEIWQETYSCDICGAIYFKND